MDRFLWGTIALCSCLLLTACPGKAKPAATTAPPATAAVQGQPASAQVNAQLSLPTGLHDKWAAMYELPEEGSIEASG